ncbi:hypothetical protein F7725_027191 [Dissostichus mawsoni]|uniref:Uncharacterized protein n=1 Tax=Dissostichus mawsoni TaxID=36200 RepID=A0A7J5XCR1_DISMA|nr:hypothetical protein F7725_027191 [Dissostichus mawsoni]
MSQLRNEDRSLTGRVNKSFAPLPQKEYLIIIIISPKYYETVTSSVGGWRATRGPSTPSTSTNSSRMSSSRTQQELQVYSHRVPRGEKESACFRLRSAEPVRGEISADSLRETLQDLKQPR